MSIRGLQTARRCAVALFVTVAMSVVAIGTIEIDAAGISAQAQTLPLATHKAFVLIEYQVKDRPLFLKLRDQVRESLKAYKGDLVMREKVAPIFGGSSTNISVIGFDSIDAARAWLASKEMAALAEQREKAAQVSTYLVEKLD